MKSECPKSFYRFEHLLNMILDKFLRVGKYCDSINSNIEDDHIVSIIREFNGFVDNICQYCEYYSIEMDLLNYCNYVNNLMRYKLKNYYDFTFLDNLCNGLVLGASRQEMRYMERLCRERRNNTLDRRGIVNKTNAKHDVEDKRRMDVSPMDVDHTDLYHMNVDEQHVYHSLVEEEIISDNDDDYYQDIQC